VPVVVVAVYMMNNSDCFIDWLKVTERILAKDNK